MAITFDEMLNGLDSLYHDSQFRTHENRDVMAALVRWGFAEEVLVTSADRRAPGYIITDSGLACLNDIWPEDSTGQGAEAGEG